MGDQAEPQPIKDIYDGFRNTIVERLSSPLLFAFSLSWLLINFRCVLILLSGEKVVYKLKLVDWYFRNYGVNHGLIFPLIAALVYVFLYPFLARHVHRFVLNRKLEIQSDDYLAERKKLVSEDDLKLIQATFYDQKEELRKEIARLNTELTEARAKLQQLGNPVVSESTSSSKTVGVSPEQLVSLEGLNDNEIKLIDELGKAEDNGFDRVRESSLFIDAGIGNVKARLAAENLQNGNYILKSNHRDGYVVYGLEKKGREVYSYLATPP